jgi:hypothetical protein
MVKIYSLAEFAFFSLTFFLKYQQQQKKGPEVKQRPANPLAFLIIMYALVRGSVGVESEDLENKTGWPFNSRQFAEQHFTPF